jgi:RHH-type transcriptional regulator, proline utilization regulon repressor / proline dehydrogenase / delta 1-pyrroline-5-carboxylate dehydrogenase
LLFRTADRLRFRRPTGEEVSKFVYLNMEEYQDKDLTAEAFMRTLDRQGLEQVRAGIRGGRVQIAKNVLKRA